MAKLKIVRKWQRSSLYKKSLILFTILLCILSSILLSYVYNSMVIYERNLVDNYIKYLATSGKLTEDVKDNLFEISKYEKSNAKISDGLKKLYQSDNLKIKKNSKLSKDEVFAYDLYNNDKLISTVSIKSTNSYTRMAILKIDEWKIVDYQNYFDKGIYAYEIKVPTNYKVYVNNQELDNSLIVKEGDVEGLERLTDYIEIEKSKTYEVNNLVYKPEIKIVDENNKEVTYEEENNKIIVTKKFKKINTLDDAKREIKDNYYNQAYNWSRNVDRTFVSNHRLKNPVFTNEEIKNFIIYNDNAFSCEVYLEKNMVVSGQDKQDIMHDRLYFIYYNDGYKLVNMEAITK